jgi:hypothetical protein
VRQIVLNHWTEGGTAITNISGDFDLFEQAVREYNDPLLVMHDKPTGRGLAGWRSLHYLGRPGKDLSAFWELVRCIEAERQPLTGTGES